MIQVFGHPASTYTRKVLCALHEIGQPFALTSLDLLGGEQRGAAHLARQPFGRVPAIEDAGFRLYESRAILRYLNDRYGGALVPEDLRVRAEMDQFLDIEYGYFAGAALTPILHHLFGFAQDGAAQEAARATIETTLDVLEARLAAAGPYLAGEAFSLADVVYLPDLGYLMATPLAEAITSRPAVAAWWARCSERPSWQAATAH